MTNKKSLVVEPWATRKKNLDKLAASRDLIWIFHHSAWSPEISEKDFSEAQKLNVNQYRYLSKKARKKNRWILYEILDKKGTVLNLRVIYMTCGDGLIEEASLPALQEANNKDELRRVSRFEAALSGAPTISTFDQRISGMADYSQLLWEPVVSKESQCLEFFKIENLRDLELLPERLSDVVKFTHDIVRRAYAIILNEPLRQELFSNMCSHGYKKNEKILQRDVTLLLESTSVPWVEWGEFPLNVVRGLFPYHFVLLLDFCMCMVQNNDDCHCLAKAIEFSRGEYYYCTAYSSTSSATQEGKSSPTKRKRTATKVDTLSETNPTKRRNVRAPPSTVNKDDHTTSVSEEATSAAVITDNSYIHRGKDRPRILTKHPQRIVSPPNSEPHELLTVPCIEESTVELTIVAEEELDVQSTESVQVEPE